MATLRRRTAYAAAALYLAGGATVRQKPWRAGAEGAPTCALARRCYMTRNCWHAPLHNGARTREDIRVGRRSWAWRRSCTTPVLLSARRMRTYKGMSLDVVTPLASGAPDKCRRADVIEHHNYTPAAGTRLRAYRCLTPPVLHSPTPPLNGFSTICRRATPARRGGNDGALACQHQRRTR